MSSRRTTSRRRAVRPIDLSSPPPDSQSARLGVNEADLRAIIDSVPSPIAYVDRDGRYRLSNRAHREWHKQESLKGMSISDLLDPAGYAAARPHFEEALRGRAVVFETQM